MGTTRQLDRRTFLADLGRGAVAIAVVSVAGCSPSATLPPSHRPTFVPTRSPEPSGPPTPSGSAPAPSSPDAAAWARVNLGFVSAYILARTGEVAVVDTGVAGSGDAIRSALQAVGLDWANVVHVILTHRHPDHAGSLAEILAAAPDATPYAGLADIPAITSPKVVKPVGDGDRVFDLAIVDTPGHTTGHIAVLDEATGTLVAGDALNTSSGRLTGSDPQFTADVGAAGASVKKLAGLRFDRLLVGHGDPIESGAQQAVAALAATLG